MDQDEPTPTPLGVEVVYKTTTYDSQDLMKPEMEPKSGSFFLYFATFIVNFTALVTGISFGWTSPILPKLKDKGDLENNPLGYTISDYEESLIASLLSFGSIFGPLISGPMANKIGRKKTILIVSCPLAISLVMAAFANTVIIFYIARFIMGVAAGSIFTILPMYLSEIAEDHNRGTIGCLMGVSIATGLLFAYAVGPFLPIKLFCLACASPLLVFFPVFLICIPETPQFLALVNEQDALKASLTKLRNKTPSEIDKEMQEILKSVQKFAVQTQDQNGLKELFSTRVYRNGLIVSVGLMVLQQLAGINAVLAYMQTIFEATGSGLSPKISTIIVGIVQLLTVMLTSAIVDRFGRKILMILSSTGSGVSLITLGLYFYLQTHNFKTDSIWWLPISSLLMFIVAFNLGYGPLPWAIMAELFPPNIKSTASTFTTVTCLVGCTIITLFFPYAVSYVGMAQCFWVFAICCFGGVLFMYLRLPETKGRSLQEIQKLLERHKKM